MQGIEAGIEAVVEGGFADGIEHSVALTEFAEAAVGDDVTAMSTAREELSAVMSAAAMVDAAGVASNFLRMVRIADSTGIPLDSPVNGMTEGMRQELGIDRFGSSANTAAPGALERVFGRALGPVAMRALGPIHRVLARLNR